MIKASELNSKQFRVGNIVLRLIQEWTTDQIQPMDILAMYQCEVAETPIEWLRPIPLTEEWLLRAGFEIKVRTSYSSGFKIDYNVWSKDGFTFNSIQNCWWYNGVLNIQPKYVHQLQNLYFALTGEELTFKDK